MQVNLSATKLFCCSFVSAGSYSNKYAEEPETIIQTFPKYFRVVLAVVSQFAFTCAGVRNKTEIPAIRAHY